jgi:hypothetical protein
MSSLTCPECNTDIAVIGTRVASMLRHMVNAGELTVGEARAELASAPLPADAAELLATWVLDRADQGDHWRAGDPETLACGCVLSYDREQVDRRCRSVRPVCSTCRGITVGIVPGPCQTCRPTPCQLDQVHEHRPSLAPGPTALADRPCTEECRRLA